MTNVCKGGGGGAGRKEKNKKAKKTEEIGNSLDATCWQNREKRGKEIWEHHFLTSVFEIHVNSSWNKFYYENMWNNFFTFINFMSWKILLLLNQIIKTTTPQVQTELITSKTILDITGVITVNELETSQW